MLGHDRVGQRGEACLLFAGARCPFGCPALLPGGLVLPPVGVHITTTGEQRTIQPDLDRLREIGARLGIVRSEKLPVLGLKRARVDRAMSDQPPGLRMLRQLLQKPHANPLVSVFF